MVNKRYITIPQLAKILGMSRIEIYRRVKKGLIPAEKVGKTYLIADQDITYILGKELGEKEKSNIEAGVAEVVRKYGELLKRLGKE